LGTSELDIIAKLNYNQNPISITKTETNPTYRKQHNDK